MLYTNFLYFFSYKFRFYIVFKLGVKCIMYTFYINIELKKKKFNSVKINQNILIVYFEAIVLFIIYHSIRGLCEHNV